MPNDSSTGGYVQPTKRPDFDEALDDSVQAAIVGITGLDADLVRPRWQPEPPNRLPGDYDWCAFGVVRTTPDWESQRAHNRSGAGSDRVQHDEMHEVMLSFFGPNASANEATLRAGFQIDQNRQELQKAGLEYIEISGPLILPALLKQKYVRRVDSTLLLRRRAEFIYPILNVQTASFEMRFDTGLNSLTTDVTPDDQP